jgi:hypothetical protein
LRPTRSRTGEFVRSGAHWVPSHANAPADCAHEKDLQMQAFSEAAEGIRTLDLLHGKQNVRFRASQESPGKERFLRYRWSATLPSFYREISGVSGLKPDSGSSRFGRRVRSRPVGAHPAILSRFGLGEGAAAAPRREQQPASANRQPADRLCVVR